MGIPMGAASVPTSVPLGVQFVSMGVTAVLSSTPSLGGDVTAGGMGVSRVTTGVVATSDVTSPGALYTWALTTANSSTRSLFAALGSSVGGSRRT